MTKQMRKSNDPLRCFRQGFNAGKQNLMKGTFGFGYMSKQNECQKEYIRGYKAGQKEIGGV